MCSTLIRKPRVKAITQMLWQSQPLSHIGAGYFGSSGIHLHIHNALFEWAEASIGHLPHKKSVEENQLFSFSSVWCATLQLGSGGEKRNAARRIWLLSSLRCQKSSGNQREYDYLSGGAHETKFSDAVSQ